MNNFTKTLAATAVASVLSVGFAHAQYGDNPAMQRDGVTMKDGKMMVMKSGKATAMDKDMTMTNGNKVMMDGTVMMNDGKKMQMRNGMMMDMSGSVVDSDKVKKPGSTE